MGNLKTSYMGLALDNPIIVGSSRLTSQLDGIKKSEDAGAGAVVLKSLFEEQIEHDATAMIEGYDEFADHADAFAFFANSSKDYYIDTYLELVEQARKAVDIPVIASVNCIHPGSWLEYADRFQKVGADALELNMFIMPSQVTDGGHEIEQRYIDLIRRLEARISIPLAVKIGYHFSGMANFLSQLDKDLQVAGLVLFNRYYKTDIDIEAMQLKAGKIISVEEEASLPLQWTALMSGELDADICASTGIHSGDSVIKMLLAGAASVQICSAMLTSGFSVIEKMKQRLTTWMDAKEFGCVDDFRGELARARIGDPEVWERSQYVKAICGIS